MRLGNLQNHDKHNFWISYIENNGSLIGCRLDL